MATVNGLPNVPGLAPGASSATGESNLRYLAKDATQLRKDAEVNKYPAYVRTAAGVKVLVANETEHRKEAPADFDIHAETVTDDDMAPVRRGPGRPRKASESD